MSPVEGTLFAVTVKFMQEVNSYVVLTCVSNICPEWKIRKEFNGFPCPLHLARVRT